MGIVSHRALSGREAGEVIRAYPIHIAVVDLGLPLESPQTPAPSSASPTGEAPEPEFEEGGPRLLELLARLSEPPPVVAVKRSRSHRDGSREISAALRLGAFAVVDRPHDSHQLNLLLEVLRRCLERHYRGRWPGAGLPSPS